jgi:anti-sigma B factor antagonist
MNEFRQLKVEEVGDVTVVHLREHWISNTLAIEELGKELYQVVAQENCNKLVLDFSSVEFLSSAALGKLISLNGKVKARKAAMKLCNIQPPVLEVFFVCNLNRLFDIRPDAAGALASF